MLCAVSGLSLQVNPNKPFNPMLGETYQGQYANGMKVFCEQVSHHPPVSCWEVVDPKKRINFTGTGHITATTRANSTPQRPTEQVRTTTRFSHPSNPQRRGLGTR